MIVSGFAAQADIVGRRVRISWDFVPEAGETLADVPPVTLRRKLRDFAYPPPALPDPFLVYNSGAFPPAPVPGSLSVTDLPTWEIKQDSQRTVFEPVSVAIAAGGRMIEVLRRTVGTVYDAAGVPLQQHFDILDTGRFPGDLQANFVYYYQLFSRNLTASGDGVESYRDAAMVTDSYGLNRTLYDSLPEIYRRHDVKVRPLAAGVDTVPEAASRFGQLRRFVDLFGIALDSIRGTAEGLRTLHDIDRVDARFLPVLAQWTAWQFSVDSEIEVRRNELKAAPRLYKLVGTLPGLRTLVSQYTGWFTQVAEFAQNIALSNRPAQRNLFAITPNTIGTSWLGVDDVSEILGFGSGNQNKTGSAGVAAKLTGTTAQPFALRAGVQLTIAVDGSTPQTIRFGPADFTNIAQATADEVAAAINTAGPGIVATVAAGHVVIASDTTGAGSELDVAPQPASLLALESAPGGRLSPLTDAQNRVRVFYESWQNPARMGASARIRYKTFADGSWRDAQTLFERTITPQGSPAALTLQDGRSFVAWVDNPHTAGSQVRFALGASRPLVPARLPGLRREPFALKDGGVLTLTGNWSGVDKYTVHAADFADPAHAKASEVKAAMNAQLTKTVAVVESNGSIRLETVAGGAPARIGVDLSRSTTARVFGFDNRNVNGTPGSWDERIDWSSALDAVSIPNGRHTELTALNVSAGAVRLAWSCHSGGKWRVLTAHWSEQIAVATASGLFVGTGAGPWSTIAGLPSTDVRTIEMDPDGALWIGTAAGVVLLRTDGTVAALTPALPSVDVRDLKLAGDGTAWIATAAGLSARTAAGVLTTITTANGLPSNDARALALGPSGSIWIATAAGLAVRQPSGQIQAFNTTTAVRDVVADFDGTVYAATAAGILVRSPGGSFITLADAATLGSPDVRALALGRNQTLWAATAQGVSLRLANTWTTFDTGSGLGSSDARTVSLAPDGVAWVGTATGLSTIAPDGSVSNLATAGAPAAVARSIHTGWSAPFELANAGGSNREPFLVLDAAKRTWLFWSNMLNAGDPNESWALHFRVFDPLTQSWGAETALTTPPAGGRASDRMPSAMQIAAGLRVYFSSDRNGGSRLWSVDVSPGGVASNLVSITDEPSSDAAPAPVVIGGAIWLLYRSDRNLSLSQTKPTSVAHSGQLPEAGAVRRYTGSLSVVLGDAARTATRRMFGDLLCYTPNRPGGGSLSDDELYTRGTIGLYVSRANRGSALTAQEASRLRALLAQFLPVNLRAIVIVVAPADTEFVYASGANIQDSYSDVFPFADALGPLSDAAAAQMPGVVILKSNTAGNVSASAADLTTLARRTFFKPVQ